MSIIHDAVQNYIDRGWQPIVVKERAKRPVSKAWQNSSPQPSNFGIANNVGVILGPTSGNLVDIDLDSQEARAVAALPELLGDLPAFGRQGLSPPGHRLVVCPDLPEDKARVHKLEADGCILEVRAGRGFTVMPPSVHEAPVVWERGAPPTSIPEMPWEQLHQLARLTGLLALALRHYPKEGARDTFCMHLGGALMHLGVPGDTGDQLLLELARLADDEEASERGAKCSVAHSRAEAGEHITGLPRLIEDHLGQSAGRALRRWLGAPSKPDTPAPDGALQVGTPAIHTFWEAAQTEFLARAPEAIFRRSGDLVRVRVLDREETEQEGSIVRRVGTIEIARITEGWLHLTADRLGIQFFKETADGKRRIVPPGGLGVLLVEPEDTRFPHLIGISTTPTLARDDPGYDPESRLLLEFPADLFPPVCQRPSKKEAREALDRIAWPLREFPFAGPGSKSVMLSAILSGVVRGEMRTCPLHAFSAPLFGTGKTKLADIVSTIVTGIPANIITHAPDEGEMEKRLIAVLLRGGSLLNIDNVSGPLTGDFLSAMLTAPTISGRVLGESRVVELDTRTMILATGNNLAPRGDLVRRVVVCRLDAGTEEPDKRQFDFDPVQDVARERGQMVADVLTVLRAFVAAGRPVRVPTLGSFEDWDLVRGALVWLGEDDPLVTQARSQGEDEDREMVREVLDIFWDKFMDQPFSVRHLHTDHDSSAREVIVGFLGRNEWDRRRAGRLLGRIRDIPCNGKVLRAEKNRVTNTLEYHVEQLPEGSDDEAEDSYREPGLPGEL